MIWTRSKDNVHSAKKNQCFLEWVRAQISEVVRTKSLLKELEVTGLVQ
jgi:hypothetical protein